ncbi:MAG: endonuclease/exonuclease/phosphatase family protein [Candidatus Omnitrophica bacterium]|nr:endonuclease/exonuclease/phosphatase family protein [Candidatus Omnitrophota bacterium]MBU1047901.1 endonuclease/exonuclease/phosphatase family protein [Candidatus Omnitrophota bacterium]MBU1630781.1 endonuclease/exonuclease/phosphatase family protein [Candidatus Omnitrophota bacterium]MBU1766961.1 endonuclease/exonuclease/phosphatase family protein [Candidatus Omnitrophota bacterium]MBU1888524.1 endonuclease/exonuclease/phosphatase family protein [Candidatus Omnitrophota bacterium]
MKKASDFFRFSFRAWGVIAAAGFVMSVSTVLSFLGALYWFLDLFAHFRVQYFIGLSIVSLLLLIPRKYNKVALCFGLLAIVNLSTILPLYFGRTTNDFNSQLSQRILSINVNTQFGNVTKVIKVIRDYNPDIVVLEEIDDKWVSSLQSLSNPYLYSKIQSREDNFGIALYSKYPFTQADIIDIGDAEVPSIFAEVATDNGRVTILATHPLPPTSKEYFLLRNAQFEGVPEYIHKATSPVMLIGDFNTSPWSYYFGKLLKETGLKDSSKGRGVQPTWPSHNPILLIPIDHCLYSTGIEIIQKEIGPNVDSDHYPVIIDFVITAN